MKIKIQHVEFVLETRPFALFRIRRTSNKVVEEYQLDLRTASLQWKELTTFLESENSAVIAKRIHHNFTPDELMEIRLFILANFDRR